MDRTVPLIDTTVQRNITIGGGVEKYDFLTLHVWSFSFRSSALASAHKRSITSKDEAAGLVPALSNRVSIYLNRLMNRSVACASTSSDCSPRKRDRFTREKSKSPSSSPVRRLSPDEEAVLSSASSSSTLPHTWITSGQSKPT